MVSPFRVLIVYWFSKRYYWFLWPLFLQNNDGSCYSSLSFFVGTKCWEREMIHVQLKVYQISTEMSIWESLTGMEGTNNFPTSGRFNPEAPISVTPSKGNLGTTRGKEKVFWPRHDSHPRPTSKLDMLLMYWLCREPCVEQVVVKLCGRSRRG